MVATPHSGACSLSIDLRSDEISATGGHRLFAQSFFKTLTAVAWEAYTASSIVVTSHWEDHSFQMTSALTRFLPPAVIRASPVLKHGCLLNNSELLLLKLVVYHKRKGSTKGCHSERNEVKSRNPLLYLSRDSSTRSLCSLAQNDMLKRQWFFSCATPSALAG